MFYTIHLQISTIYIKKNNQFTIHVILTCIFPFKGCLRIIVPPGRMWPTFTGGAKFGRFEPLWVGRVWFLTEVPVPNTLSNPLGDWFSRTNGPKKVRFQKQKGGDVRIKTWILVFGRQCGRMDVWKCFFLFGDVGRDECLWMFESKAGMVLSDEQMSREWPNRANEAVFPKPPKT